MRRFVRSRLFIALAIAAAVPAVLAGTGPTGADDNSQRGSQAAKEGQADHDADRADIRKVSEALVGAFGAGMPRRWPTSGRPRASSSPTTARP